MRAMKLLNTFRLTAVACVAAMLIIDIAWAQQKYKISTTADGQTSKYTQQHKIDVGDVPGHQIRIQETQRIHNEKSALAFAGVK